MRPVFCALRIAVILCFAPVALLGQEHEFAAGELVIEFGEIATTADLGAQSIASLGSQFALLRFDSILGDVESAESYCGELVKSGRVRSCSPNYVVRTNIVPNDPKFGALYGMSMIDTSRAWIRATGAAEVVIAVIDTGIDYTHPDLVDNIWRNPSEILNGIDDDGNGVVDDIHGFSAIDGSGDPMDENGHGTHVAGTIGATGNNGKGVVGVSWKVSMMGLKFLDKRGSGSLAGAIRALNYLTQMRQRGIPIIASNNSWGGGAYSEPLKSAIEASRQAGVLFVAAAGNESNDNDERPAYPASYDLDNIISVAAVDRNVRLANFSNFGATTVHVGAPGVDIESTYPGGGYRALSGTSMAAPHVSGAVALLRAHQPNLSWQEIREQILLSGADAASLQGVVASGRLLNVGRLLSGEFSPLPEPEPPTACTYAMTSVPFSPPEEKEGGNVVVRGDELGFHSFDLPFEFPFYGRNITAATISPNGVLYLGRQPTGMDFVVGESAPKESIAALHTDLFAATPLQGVRLTPRPERVDISWKMRPFGASDGFVDVSLSLFPDGTIEDFIGFSSIDIERAVQAKALIGMRGAGSGNVDTYANSNASITDRLALRMTPLCESEPSDRPRIDAISLEPRDNRKIARDPSMSLSATFWGAGTGEASYRFMVNQRLCSEVGTVPIDNGRGDLAFSLRRLPKRLRSFGIVSGRASAKIFFGQAKRTRSWVRTASFSKLCRSAINRASAANRSRVD